MNAITKQPSESQSERVLAKIILLGLDVHADSITVVRQIDGGMPQPAQKFSWAGLLDWMKRQREGAEAVWSCYEAGPFGYGPHRQLEALGVNNLVVCPQSWDELSTGVKTDRGEARALCVRLALYAAGNPRTSACSSTKAKGDQPHFFPQPPWSTVRARPTGWAGHHRPPFLDWARFVSPPLGCCIKHVALAPPRADSRLDPEPRLGDRRENVPPSTPNSSYLP